MSAPERFVERHGLWTAAQHTAAMQLVNDFQALGIEVVRFSFPDQHGVLRGKTLTVDEASRAIYEGVALTSTLLAKDTSDLTRRTQERELPHCQGLIVSDYGKGVITRASLEHAIGLAKQQGIPIAVDPKESHIDAYRGVSILTPNQHEAGWVMGQRITDEASLMEVGWGLQKRLDAECALITRGPEGMSLFERNGQYTHLPTVAREVYDVTGAGDTVVSVVALALAAGATYPEACYLANHAAGVVIREVGTATCSPEQLRSSIADVLP